MLGEPEVVRGDDLLAFAGIEPAVMRLYPVETHLAEKLHAYTLPRPSPSTRVKDLPDLALLGQTGEREASRVRAAIRQTFDYRGTHDVPERLPDPPAAWEKTYAEMAREDTLPWPSLAAVTEAARAFVDPVLEGSAGPRGGSSKTWRSCEETITGEVTSLSRLLWPFSRAAATR